MSPSAALAGPAGSDQAVGHQVGGAPDHRTATDGTKMLVSRYRHCVPSSPDRQSGSILSNDRSRSITQPRTRQSPGEAGRQRYFTINWIQFATTWAAFALFLVALISL
jgi:hypothetical protein